MQYKIAPKIQHARNGLSYHDSLELHGVMFTFPFMNLTGKKFWPTQQCHSMQFFHYSFNSRTANFFLVYEAIFKSSPTINQESDE